MACQPVIHRFIENALGGRLRWMNHELARLLGDVQAAHRGPEAMGKRLAGRQAGRMTSRVLGRWFR
jgi:hypothetical protein